MSNKKRFYVGFIFLLLILNIFIIPIIKAETSPVPDVNGDVNPETGLPPSIETVKGIGENLTDKEKREYLFSELKKIALKNKYISTIDSFFKKISFVFVVLFGEPYTLSGILLLIVILWFYFFFKFSSILKNFSAFSQAISWIMGFAITVIMAQTKILRKISEFFIWIIFYNETTWWRLLAAVIIFGALAIIYVISSMFEEKYKKEKEKKEKEDGLRKIKEGAKTSEAIIEAITEE